jgi:hypothetical protein
MPGGPDREREIQREIEDHLELEAESLQRDEEPLSDARRRARLAFGNPVTVQEDMRAVWARVWLERLIYDVRHAVRLWMASPALAGVAILTMALGIGASTAIVGQINAVFWTPLAVTAPQQLRQVIWSATRFSYVAGGAVNVLPGPDVDGAPTFGSFSYPAYEAFRDESTAFSDLACWADFGEARPVTLGELGFGAVQFVSGNYFRTVGVNAALGRTIQPGEDTPEQWTPVAMIGHRFWQRVFGGDPAVTSRTLKLNGRTFAIVGVVPESFTGLDPATPADVLLPIGAASISAQTVNPLRNRGIWSICRVVGRLRAGASEGQARAEIEHAFQQQSQRSLRPSPTIRRGSISPMAAPGWGHFATRLRPRSASSSPRSERCSSPRARTSQASSSPGAACASGRSRRASPSVRRARGSCDSSSPRAWSYPPSVASSASGWPTGCQGPRGR